MLVMYFAAILLFFTLIPKIKSSRTVSIKVKEGEGDSGNTVSMQFIQS